MADTQADDGTTATTRRVAAEEPPTRVASTLEPPSSGAAFLEQGTSAAQTLLAGEIERSRVFVRVALLICLCVAVTAPFMQGDPFARVVLYAGLLVVSGSCAVLSWRLRQDAGYTERVVAFTSFACAFGVLGGIYFFGTTSPAPAVLIFGLAFFSVSQSFRTTLAVLLTCCILHAAMVIGPIAGVTIDRGVVSGDALPAVDRLAMMVVIEAIMVATWALGRAARRASLDAVERHDRAVRRLMQREALLREARQELELALQAGGIGRYTDVVLGSFRLGPLLGRGGMGEVYEATHLESGQPAAVKVLLKHLLGEVENVRRFLREAQIVKQLDAPNVVRVLEIGGLDAPTPYIAMELLQGEDLADILRRRRQLTLRVTLELVRQVGNGLAVAHAAGIVHRDVKPRNLFCTRPDGGPPVWKVLDFGISKLAHHSGTLTRGDLVGTPAYMAPEQATGGGASALSDLYSLGVIAYRALTGRPPFSGIALPDTIYKVVHTMPPRPSSTLATLPPGIDDVLAVAIAKDPERRFQSIDELVAALEVVEDGRFDPKLRRRAEALLEEHPWSSDSDAPG